MQFQRWATALILMTALAGCLSSGNEAVETPETSTPGITTVFERAELPFETEDSVMSHTLEAGDYGILPGKQFFVNVPLPATENVAGALGRVDVSIGIFFPEIPGCDWESDALADHCRVPVIADIGPYYSATIGQPGLQTEGDAPVDQYTCNRLLCNPIENFVPHGYAVAAVSVLGTGDSGGCQDLMGAQEQAGIHAAVEFMGNSSWSNGAVALIGRSYDGSTPWEAAMVDSPYLKTIVPISGLMGQHDLMWRNGSAELRGPGVLYGLYAAMTIDGDASDAEQVICPDYLTGGPLSALAYTPAGTAPDAGTQYWSERYFFDEVMANYNGSVYFIHGMQDWNVDNHQAFPYYNELLDKGLEMKGLFGQWGHMYPDRASEHDNLGAGFGAEAYPASVRMDWAQDLLEWFDHYLMGTGPQPPLHVEIQDNMGNWRVEAEYPPRDATRMTISLSNDTAGAADPALIFGSTPIFSGGVSQTETYLLPALSATEDTQIAGNVLFHASVTPTGPGGQLFARIHDAETGLRLGHAIMDLRYHEGGKEAVTVVPGMPIVAKMEFFALDAVLPAGHGIELFVASTGMDYLPSSVSDPVQLHKEGSTLIVPTVERSAETFFVPPPFSG